MIIDNNKTNATTSHLKKVFWPNIFVGSLFQVLDILQYACGLEKESVAILNQNPFFDMACNPNLTKSKKVFATIGIT